MSEGARPGPLSLEQRKQLVHLECALDRLELELLLDEKERPALERALRGLVARGWHHALFMVVRHVAIRVAKKRLLG